MERIKTYRSKPVKELHDKFEHQLSRMETQFQDFHIQEKNKAEKKGKKDGTNDVPKAGTKFGTPAEQEIRHSYQREIEELSGETRKFLHELEHSYLSKYKERLKKSTTEERKEDMYMLEEEWERKLDNMEIDKNERKELVRNKDEYKQAERDYQRARSEFEHISNEEEREETDRRLGWGYWLIMVFIALSEVVYNFFAFELIGESFWVTIVTAAGVGIVIAIIAHFAGSYFKRNGLINREGGLVVLGILVIIGLGTYALNRLRAYYVMEQGLLPEQASTFVFLLFFVFTLLFFIAGCWAAYYHNDSNPEFVRLKKKMEDKKSIRDKKASQLDDEIERIMNEYNEDFEALEEEYKVKIYRAKVEDEILTDLINDVIGRYNSILRECQYMEKEINSAYKETICTYRDANNSVRREQFPEWVNIEDLEMPLSTKIPKTHLAQGSNPNLN